MERRVHLPRWVAEKFSRQAIEEAHYEASRQRRLVTPGAVKVRNVQYHSGTKPLFDKMATRRRGKRARLARKGRPTHNFRIHT